MIYPSGRIYCQGQSLWSVSYMICTTVIISVFYSFVDNINEHKLICKVHWRLVEAVEEFRRRCTFHAVFRRIAQCFSC